MKIVFCYLLFHGLFLFYFALIDPGGDISFPFIQKYPPHELITMAIVYPVKVILTLIGYETRNTIDSVGKLDGYGVKIAFACIGMKFMLTYTALLIAFKGSHKFQYWIYGILLIHFLNILRVLSIILIYQYDYEIANISHTVFNYGSYTIVILFFYLWYKNHSYSFD